MNALKYNFIIIASSYQQRPLVFGCKDALESLHQCGGGDLFHSVLESLAHTYRCFLAKAVRDGAFVNCLVYVRMAAAYRGRLLVSCPLPPAAFNRIDFYFTGFRGGF